MARRTFDRPTGRTGNLLDMHTREFVRPMLPAVCERIRHFRELRQMDQKQLAQAVGVQPNAVSNWETGRSRPDVNLLPEICRALGISLNQLYDLEGAASGDTQRERLLVETFRGLSYANQLTVQRLAALLQQAETLESLPKMTEKIAFLRPLAAGVGDPSDFEEEGEPILLIASPVVERSDYVFTVNGESMEPLYRDGDQVLIQGVGRGARLNEGEVGAFMTENELYIKVYDPKGLRSLNPDYPLMPFEQFERVYLIGRVLGVLEDRDRPTPRQAELYRSMQERVLTGL